MKSKFAFLNGNPHRRRFSVRQNRFLDFVFYWESKIWISHSNVPIYNWWFPLHSDCDNCADCRSDNKCHKCKEDFALTKVYVRRLCVPQSQCWGGKENGVVWDPVLRTYICDRRNTGLLSLNEILIYTNSQVDVFTLCTTYWWSEKIKYVLYSWVCVFIMLLLFLPPYTNATSLFFPCSYAKGPCNK